MLKSSNEPHILILLIQFDYILFMLEIYTQIKKIYNRYTLLGGGGGDLTIKSQNSSVY